MLPLTYSTYCAHTYALDHFLKGENLAHERLGAKAVTPGALAEQCDELDVVGKLSCQ